MKKQTIILSSLAFAMLSLTGCSVVEGIFKAGMVWGIILVFLVVFGLVYLFTRGRGK